MTQWLMALVGVCCLTSTGAAQAQPEQPAPESTTEETLPARAGGEVEASDEEGGGDATSTQQVESDEEMTADSPAEDDVVVVTEGGLFESAGSEAGAGEATEDGGGVAPTYELGGYVRGDVFVGKVPNLSSFQTKAAYGAAASAPTVPAVPSAAMTGKPRSAGDGT